MKSPHKGRRKNNYSLNQFPTSGTREFYRDYDFRGKKIHATILREIIDTYFNYVFEDIVVGRKVYNWPKVGKFFILKVDRTGGRREMFDPMLTHKNGKRTTRPEYLSGGVDFTFYFQRAVRVKNVRHYSFTPTQKMRTMLHKHIVECARNPKLKDYDAISFT